MIWTTRRNTDSSSRYRFVFALSLSLLGALLLASTAEAQVVREWVRQEPGFRAVDVAIDADGFIYATGLSPRDAAHNFRHDIVTVKYDTAGNVVWKREFDETDDGTNGDDTPNWMTLDPDGNILVAGRSFINGTGDDLIVLKYAPNGDLLWKARTPAAVEAHRVATDSAGNVFVGGKTTDANTRDYFTAKYDEDGNLLWSATYNGPNNFTDEVNAIGVTASGDVVVTGESTGGVTLFDIATIYYEADGTQRWVRRYTSPGSEFDRGEDVAIGPSGEIFVGGWASPNGDTDFVIVEYDGAGNEVDVMLFDNNGAGDLGKRVVADSQGNVVITGISGPSDIVTVKYDPDGHPLWVATYSSQGEDFPWGMEVGADDSIYVTGETLSGAEVVTIKYNPDGTEAWSDTVDASQFPDRGYNVAVDANDSVAVAAQAPILTIYYTQRSQLALTVESGTCPGPVMVRVDNAPSNSEVAVLAAANTSGFVKGGALCNGTLLEIGEPFQLPPTFVKVDGSGSGTGEIGLHAEFCQLEALAFADCSTSGAVAVPVAESERP